MTGSLCHESGGGFWSTTLGGELKLEPQNANHRFTRMNANRNELELPALFTFSGSDLCHPCSVVDSLMAPVRRPTRREGFEYVATAPGQ